MPRRRVTVDFSSLKGKLTKINKKLRDEGVGKDIVNTIVDNIRNNSINPSTGKRYRKLESSSINSRRYLARNNKTHPNYSPNEPNLTITGRLLESIKAKITVSTTSIEYAIDVTGRHARYKSNSGTLIGKKTPTNKEIREGLSKIGRDPLGLSKKIEKEIVAFIRKEITKLI